MEGYLGRILQVDLSHGTTRETPLEEGYLRKFIGGSGLAARYLYDLADPSVDPLGPDNPLIFMTGPLVGTRSPSCGRYAVCARSPATGLLGEANSGGFFGPQLRFSGYDGMIIHGKANKPVYLSIQDRHAELKDASRLWGLDSQRTQEAVKKDLKDTHARVACIGPAGEKSVAYAAIMNDSNRAAARSGMGAVMGAKNLKAIAVRGHLSVPLAREAAFHKAARWSLEEVKKDVTTDILRTTGTAGLVDYALVLGNMPHRYFSQGEFPEAEKLGGATMAESILAGIRTCFGCPVGCGRVVKVDPLGKIAGPEYETVAALGSMLLISDLVAVSRLNNLCNLCGLDTISTGVTLALAYYLYQEGIINSADTGLALSWGDAEAAYRLIEMIAARQGFGDLLARGARATAEHYGVPDLAAQVNGLEVAMHDPRATAGMALVYVTSPRGACHNKSDYYWMDFGRTVEELGIGPMDRFQVEGKAELVIKHQNWRAFCDSLVACTLVNLPIRGLLEMINAATGFNLSLDDVLPTGERIIDLKRALNLKLGLKPEDERLPPHLLKPLEGPTAGFVPDVPRLLQEYYQIRGWDRASGELRPERLLALGLEETKEGP